MARRCLSLCAWASLHSSTRKSRIARESGLHTRKRNSKSPAIAGSTLSEMSLQHLGSDFSEATASKESINYSRYLDFAANRDRSNISLRGEWRRTGRFAFTSLYRREFQIFRLVGICFPSFKIYLN